MAFSRDFIQQGPQVSNTFLSDDLLQALLRWRLPNDVCASVEADLRRFGERCATELLAYAQDAEAKPPHHIAFDAWGKRIDDIEVAPGWNALHRVAAEEGIVAIGYERAFGAHSRLVQLAKLYLFHPSSAFYSCPLAMTDGAARVLELLGGEELKSRAFTNLTSRDPEKFWTSGQWMTERTGGSDVSLTTTVARWEHGTYRLYGDKWFTSATTAPMALALAKVEGDVNKKSSSTLSLFYLELRDTEGRLQNIRIERLKDKLGTHALPTAELSLNGVPARLIGEIGDGVRNVSALLNITRLYNSICSLGSMARCLTLAKDYARKRLAFGKPVSEQPLHLETLARMQTEFEGTFHLCFHLATLLGREETGQATPSERVLLRLLTPVIKLWSAKSAISIASETVEAFGGAGYIENTGIPVLLRDAQVFSIWEGTTNILSLDVLRVLKKENALEVFMREVEVRLSALDASKALSGAKDGWSGEITQVRAATKLLGDHIARVSAAANAEEALQTSARAIAFGIGRTMAAALMLEFAQWCGDHGVRAASKDIVRRFCRESLVDVSQLSANFESEALKKIVFG
jgi:alkylation response protein AidB-like acyl-CoA dehydrogenase